jgi:D-glycero-D-manno-heptose 1,7-bisphosphate phosphatase
MKTIFIDRDGVINKEVGYLHKITDFVFIDGVFEACKHLQSLGYQLIIITNQSGIGRGYYTEDDFQTLTAWMLQEFNNNDITITDVFHCPHAPDEGCNCRKPQAGMFEQAQQRYDVDVSHSWMIGDKEDDIRAANNFGIFNTILVESGHAINKTSSNASYILPSIKDVKICIKK